LQGANTLAYYFYNIGPRLKNPGQSVTKKTFDKINTSSMLTTGDTGGDIEGVSIENKKVLVLPPSAT
jgi:hypothetical protein